MTTPLTEKEQTARRLSALANLLESRPNSHAMAENIALIREGAAAIEALAGSADVSREPAFKTADESPIVEVWHGTKKVTVYRDTVIWMWGPHIDNDMRDEPRTLESMQRAFDWLYSSVEETKPVCDRPHSQLLATKGDQFEMRKCLNCTNIFRVRLSQKASAPIGIMYESRSDTEFTDCVNCNQTPLSHAATMGRCPPKASVPCQPNGCEVQDYYDGLIQKSPTDDMREMRDHFDSLTPTVNGEIP